MINRRIGALAAALALALTGVGAGQALAAPPVWTHEASDLAPHPRATFGRLPNGFRYVILTNTSPAKGASLRLRLDVGSLHEAEDERGLAHFLEHLAFAGSKNVGPGELFRSLERIGVRKGDGVNAFTSATQTTYNMDLPLADEASLDVALKLMREVGALTLDSKAIDAERLVVLNEKRLREGPMTQLTVDQFAYWFPGRRAGDRLPIGTEQVIRTAPYETIRDFYRRYYRPDRAVLVIVGDVEAAKVEAKIRALFADWQAQGPPGQEPDLGAPGARKASAKVFVEGALPPRVALTWIRPHDPAPQTMDSIRAMIAEYLGLAVLNRRLERQASGAAPPFTAALAQREDALRSGRLTVMQASAPADGRAALQALIVAQRQLLEHGVSPSELQVEIAEWRARLQNRAYGTVTEPSGRLADEIIQTLEENGVFTSSEQDIVIFDQAVKGMTPDDLEAALRRSFSGEGPLVTVVTPVAVEGGEETVLAAVNEAQIRPVAPPNVQAKAWAHKGFGAPGKVTSQRKLEDLDTTLATFANGVRLTVKPTKFRTGQVLVGVRIGEGRLALPADRSSPDWAATAFVLGGLQSMSYDDISQALAGKVWSVAPSVTDNAFRLDGSTRPEDFETQLQVMAAYVAEPGWRTEAFERVRSQLGVNVSRTDGTPGGILQRQVRTLMRGGDRRWAQPTALEIRAAKFDELKAALGPQLASGALEVTVVGDVTAEQAIAAVARTFGALPPRARPADGTALAKGPTFPQKAVTPVRLQHYGRDDQSLALTAWPIPDFFADPQAARTLRVMEQVIALRLFDRLRGEQGLAYATETEMLSSEVFSGYGYLMAMAEVKPQDGDKVFAGISEIVADLRAREISADELERAKRPRVEEYAAGRQTNGYWLVALAGVHEDPRRIESARTLLPQIQAVTPADLRAVAQRYLTDERAWKAHIVPVDQSRTAAVL